MTKAKKAASGVVPKAPAESRALAVTNARGDAPIPKVADATVSAACLIVDYSKAMWNGAEVSLNDTADALADTLRDVRGGKLGEVEDLLMSQALALNAVFVDLSFRAAR